MKKLVSLFLALLMVLSFGLLTAASAEPKEIVFWTALAGAYNDVIQNICADFNATQDEWKVVPEYQGNYYDIAAKLQASLLDGSEPDIVQMECSRTPLFSDYGAFAELSDMLANVGLDAKEYFYDGFMVDCDWGEGLYALPFNRSTPMFYYNKTLFDEMGLTAPGPLGMSCMRPRRSSPSRASAGALKCRSTSGSSAASSVSPAES